MVRILLGSCTLPSASLLFSLKQGPVWPTFRQRWIESAEKPYVPDKVLAHSAIHNGTLWYIRYFSFKDILNVRTMTKSVLFALPGLPGYWESVARPWYHGCFFFNAWSIHVDSSLQLQHFCFDHFFEPWVAIGHFQLSPNIQGHQNISGPHEWWPRLENFNTEKIIFVFNITHKETTVALRILFKSDSRPRYLHEIIIMARGTTF